MDEKHLLIGVGMVGAILREVVELLVVLYKLFEPCCRCKNS
jgi:hypothetical protein